MEYGELAVNYNTGDPALFIKDSANNIVRVSDLGEYVPLGSWADIAFLP